MPLHPIVVDAAEGKLPHWAVAGPSRRQHMSRVAELLETWAEELSLDPDEVTRWRAAGHLHDVLRDAEPDTLRPRVPPVLRSLPSDLLHGPAAAERLRVEGIDDGALLHAIAFHTVGSPGFRRVGRVLYAADFLEPGRPYLPDWRAELRGRMPDELDAVTREIVGARIRHRLDAGEPILPRTLEFWNRLCQEEA